MRAEAEIALDEDIARAEEESKKPAKIVVGKALSEEHKRNMIQHARIEPVMNK